MSTDSISQLRSLVISDHQSPDYDARSEFFRHFGDHAEEFATYIAVSLDKWIVLHNDIPENDFRRLTVVAILFATINFHSSSFKLFISGYTVAAGGMFRQV